MATDVARLSFDPARRFTGVVPQQGRVTLEAEQNEQRVIDAEERRRELIEIVGPAGTPDDGYAVTGGDGTLLVGTGTMYVGGNRVQLDSALDVRDQPDWLDRPDDAVQLGHRAHVLLTLTESDVTAIEDPALYEVALGGPDGAARTRLLQHVEVMGFDGDDCASAMQHHQQIWSALGLDFEPATMRLASRSRLAVTFQAPTGGDDPCEPTASGGYLGAENQLIRVQITAADPLTGHFSLAWCYDDASMLYRVTPDEAGTGLVLDRSPVDDHHRPRTGQTMQLLRSTAALLARDAQVEGYVAASDGVLVSLAAPYDPDTKTVPWPQALPPEYADPTKTPQQYLRAWEEHLTGLTVGTPIDLGGTGLRVTLTTDGGGTPHVGDYWCIGVRPGTPTAVYPQRLLRNPQPPDGPLLWACPLAVVDWSDDGDTVTVLEDCRHHFRPLVDIEGGCCTLEVTPADAAAGRLQAKIDSAAAGRALGDRAARITICFAPGHYELTGPIELTAMHSRITLQGCNRAAVLSARPDAADAFPQGLIVLTEADDVTITGLELRMPLVRRQQTIRGSTGGTFDRAAVRAVNALAANSYVSIGIRPVSCAVLTVTQCLFRFAVGPLPAPDEVADIFAIGIFSGGNVWGADIRGNEFRHDPLNPVPDGGPRRLLIGYLGTLAAVPDPAGGRTGSDIQGTLQDNLEICENEFAGLAAAVYLLGDLGSVRLSANRVRDCYVGFYLIEALALIRTDLTTLSTGDTDPAVRAALERAQPAVLATEVPALVTAFGTTYPLPALREDTPGREHVDTAASRLRAAADEARRTFTARLAERVAAEHPADEAPVSRPEPGPTAARGVQAAVASVRELLRLAAAARADEETSAAATIHACANDIDCRLPDDAPTSFGIAIQCGHSGADSAIVSDNRVITDFSGGAIALSGLDLGTVTGNICVARTDNQDGLGLDVISMYRATITGNICTPWAFLPANRPFPPPFNTWRPLNTIG